MSEVEDEAEGWGQGASQDGLFWASLGSGAAFPESVVRSSSEQCPPVDCRVPCSSEPASVPTFAFRGSEGIVRGIASTHDRTGTVLVL